MRDTEEILRQVMKRADPPEGFADRVISLIESEQRNVSSNARRSWLGSARGIAAAAAVTIVIGAGFYGLNERRMERDGLRARQEVLLALSIASEKTSVAREAVIRPLDEAAR